MLQLEFSARDLALTRFAFSPLWEVVASVRVLKEPAAHALHLPWVKRVRPRLAASGLDLRPLADLVPVPGHLLPGFLAPTPETPTPDLGTELTALRAVEAADVRADLVGLRTRTAALLCDDPPAGLGVLTAVIEAFWQLALEPFWPRIRSLLEGDVLYRSRLLAEGGADRLLNDLDPAIAWTGERLTVRHPLVSETRTLAGRGLVLVPSAFIWPHVASKTSDPWQPVLRYSARGIATLWERGVGTTPEALARVVGGSRARLLAELGSPASTSELARRTGMSAGGVSQHLTALRAAGLVTAHRTGRSVLYARTATADALVSPVPAQP